MKNWSVKLFLTVFAFAFYGLANAATCVATHTVARGETLSGILVGYGIRPTLAEISNVSAANSIQDPNRIQVDQKICFPKGFRVSTVKPMDVATLPGEKRWVNVGGAPLKGCGKKDEATINAEAWAALGISTAQQEELKTLTARENHDYVKLSPGDRFSAGTFCENGKAMAWENVVAAWPVVQAVYARTYVLADGNVWYWVMNCKNWVRGTRRAPTHDVIEELLKAPAPVALDVVVPVTSSPVAVVTEETPVAKAAVYEHQVDAYIGYGKVWHGDSHYGYAGFDWYIKQWVFVDENGKKHRLGFGADYSLGSGVAGTDGHFAWDALTLRPVAYKLEGPDGKTLRMRILVTRISDSVKADQARYENERQMYQWGPEVIFTDQGRKDSGEKLFSEHRFSLGVLFAFNKSGHQSWEGTPITDTTELLKVKGMIRGGARLYVYDLDGGYRTFVQTGFSAQWPNVARSVGLSVGIEGPDELWTVFVGPNFDLKQHTHSFGAEVSLQIGKAYLHYQGLAAQSGLIGAVECIEDGAYAYFPSKGVLVSGTCPKDTETGMTIPDAPQQQAPRSG